MTLAVAAPQRMTLEAFTVFVTQLAAAFGFTPDEATAAVRAAGLPLDDRLALTIDESAAVCGVSRRTIQYALSRGDIRGAYPNSHPTIPVEHLREWLLSLPDEAPGK